MKQPRVWWRNKNGKDTELECVSPEGPFSGLLALNTSTSSLTKQRIGDNAELCGSRSGFTVFAASVLAAQPVSAALPHQCFVISLSRWFHVWLSW